MDEVDVYNAAVAEFSEKWDAKRPAGCPALAGVGKGGRGVYAGLPVIIQGMPCLGVMPVEVTPEPLTNDPEVGEQIEFPLEVYFYVFDMDKEQEANLVLLMFQTIRNIVKANKTLSGKLDFWRVTKASFGAMIRQSAEGGGDIAVAGGVVNIVCWENR